MTLIKILNAPFIIVVRIGHIHVGNCNPDDLGQSVEVYLVLAWKELGKAVDFTKITLKTVKHLKNLENCGN